MIKSEICCPDCDDGRLYSWTMPIWELPDEGSWGTYLECEECGSRFDDMATVLKLQGLLK